MVKFWQQIAKGEKGQAILIVLVLLVLGGLLIVPALKHAATGINIGHATNQSVRGAYAAEAGVEQILWHLKHSQAPPEALLPEVNGMAVTMEIEDCGPYTVAYHGELLNVSESGHFDWLSVDGAMVWNEDEEAYEYTITVTVAPEAEGTIHLIEVGCRLPIGYIYVADSAADPAFPENLSDEEPNDVEDGVGAHMLSWDLLPKVGVKAGDPPVTQAFYTTGEGDLSGEYTWVVADRDDIGEIGEFSGTLYKIIATATHPEDSDITATITVHLIWDDDTGDTMILYWKVNPQ